MTSVTRRRSRNDDDEQDEREDRPTRRRSRDRDEEPEERPTRRSRRDRDEDEEDERPTRRRSRSRDEDEEEEDRPRRSRRRGGDEDEDRPRRRKGTSGFAAAHAKKRSTGNFADEFKPGANNPTLIKILDEEPFDSYNQHWIDEMKEGERKSYCCRDDEDYFGDDDGCPLCDIGEPAKTFSLFNVLDLSKPRKPEVKVWAATPAVSDLLERAASEKKTSPLNREDLYFEVELTKKGKKYQWVITPVKARDLLEDFDMEPLDADELEDFSQDLFTDRTSVTKVDSYEDLLDLADSLD